MDMINVAIGIAGVVCTAWAVRQIHVLEFRPRKRRDLVRSAKLRPNWYRFGVTITTTKRDRQTKEDVNIQCWIVEKDDNNRLRCKERREMKMMADPVMVVKRGEGFGFDLENTVVKALREGSRIKSYYDLRKTGVPPNRMRS